MNTAQQHMQVDEATLLGTWRHVDWQDMPDRAISTSMPGTYSLHTQIARRWVLADVPSGLRLPESFAAIILPSNIRQRLVLQAGRVRCEAKRSYTGLRWPAVSTSGTEAQSIWLVLDVTVVSHWATTRDLMPYYNIAKRWAQDTRIPAAFLHLKHKHLPPFPTSLPLLGQIVRVEVHPHRFGVQDLPAGLGRL